MSKQDRRTALMARMAEEARQAEIRRWQPREGRDRPTDERRAKGVFALRDTEDAGVTVAVDEGGTEIDRLAARGLITEDQRQAGHDLAAVLYRTGAAPAGRSCLDVTPRGHPDGDAEETHHEARDRQQRQQVWIKCRGSWVWPELVRVCGHDEPVRHLESLRAGLDVCSRVFGK